MRDDDTIFFVSVCPNGHTPTLKYRKFELQNFLDSRNAGFKLFCGICNTFWTPTLRDRANIRKLLEARPNR